MDTGMFLGQLGFGLTLGLAAVGSAVGIGTVGRAAVGCWAREAREGGTLRFSYIVLMGMPLSQTIYAFVLMFAGLKEGVLNTPSLLAAHSGIYLGFALAGGIAELISAWMQGMIGAAACRALCDGQGKGLGLMFIAMGITETVGLFGFVFLLLMIPA